MNSSQRGTQSEDAGRYQQAFEAIVEYFSAELQQPTGDALRLNKYRQAREVFLADAQAAVPFLAPQFDSYSFTRKEVAYDLLILLGDLSAERIPGLLAEVGPVSRLWLVSVLNYLGDRSHASVVDELVRSQVGYIRHLSALAAVFQQILDYLDQDNLMETLSDALLTDERIEGSAFFIADSALSCITLVTGQRFADWDTGNLEFLNFNDYLFEPPLHPFPYTNDRVTVRRLEQRLRVANRVRAWWNENRTTTRLRVPEDFPPFGEQAP